MLLILQIMAVILLVAVVIWIGLIAIFAYARGPATKEETLGVDPRPRPPSLP